MRKKFLTLFHYFLFFLVLVGCLSTQGNPDEELTNVNSLKDPPTTTISPSIFPTANDQEDQDAIEEVLPINEDDLTPTLESMVEVPPAYAYYEERLIFESNEYISTKNAQEIANQLGFIDGCNESASNACGPLSIAILREAGLISDCVNLHDIWLLNLREPGNQQEILYRNYFPPQLYDYKQVNESVRTYDFTTNPLEPGDWLFLFTAGNGFDHMLTVTRVDQDGAAYTVTNIDRGDGFVISEEKLYDPASPEEGLFFELTDNVRKNLGKTGTKGFLLIRRKGGLDAVPALNKEIRINLADSVYWRIIVRDINHDEILFESLPNQVFHPASMIKAPLGAIALKILEENGLKVSDFSKKGFDGRTFDQLFYGMIVLSEEDAAESLLDFIRENGGERRFLDCWGMNDTIFEPRRTTAFDLDTFLKALYQGEILSPLYNDYLLKLMQEKTENDSAYLGVITQVLTGATISNKRGLLLDPTIVSDMGIVTFEDQAYSIVVSGSLKKNGAATYEALQKSLEDFVHDLGEMLIER